MKGIENLYVVVAGDDHVRQFKESWTPFFFAKGAIDATWPYRLFNWIDIIRSEMYFTVAAVDAEGKLEGLIAIRAARPFLKVSFLATAPWNTGNEKARKGIGPALLAWAIGVSKNAKFGGALTLSSTPESESFYDSRGFVRTGEYDEEGLAIFQLPIERVPTFLAAHDGFKASEAL